MCLYSQLLKWNCSAFTWGHETTGANHLHISRGGSWLSVTFPGPLGKVGKFSLCRTEWTGMAYSRLKNLNGKRQAGSLLWWGGGGDILDWPPSTDAVRVKNTQVPPVDQRRQPAWAISILSTRWPQQNEGLGISIKHLEPASQFPHQKCARIWLDSSWSI